MDTGQRLCAFELTKGELAGDKQSIALSEKGGSLTCGSLVFFQIISQNSPAWIKGFASNRGCERIDFCHDAKRPSEIIVIHGIKG